MSKTFVMGDVHGGHKAMLQVFERAGFDRENDRLIFLGDVADGWPDTRQCIDELLTVKNLVALLGNHDSWFNDWVTGEGPEPLWVHQGGRATLQSYGGLRENVPASHARYLREAKLWHEEDGRMFVHAGWPYFQHHPQFLSDEQLLWDRTMWQTAVFQQRLFGPDAAPLTKFREVYIGHSTTTPIGFTEPVQCCEVWNLDQGAGWEGKLSLMDIDTKEFWQSDVVAELYPNHAGRRSA